MKKLKFEWFRIKKKHLRHCLRNIFKIFYNFVVTISQHNYLRFIQNTTFLIKIDFFTKTFIIKIKKNIFFTKTFTM